MIVFYADSGWEVDLTNTSITLIEENALFFDYFIKDYSLPSSSNIEQFSNEQIRFLNLENVSLATARYTGNLLVDTQYKKAYLTIVSVKGKVIKHIIYYGDNTIPLLETKLAALPFKIITVGGLAFHAKAIIAKKYPEVGYNFPMIIDQDFSKTANYKEFLGVINNFNATNQSFITNTVQTVNGKQVVFNNNIITPYPYLMHVLKVGFDAAGLTMVGDLVNDKVNEHLIWDTSKFLEKFSTSSEDSYIFSYPSDEFIERGEVVYSYVKIFSGQLLQSHKLKIYLNLPVEIEIVSFKVFHLQKEIYSSAKHHLNDEVIINITEPALVGNIKVELKTRPHQYNLFIYNKLDISVDGDKLNEFPRTFSIADVLPDISFAKFLAMVKGFFKLKVFITDNLVHLDYIASVLDETDFPNKEKYQTEEPLKTAYPTKLFKLSYTKDDFMYIDYKGEAFNPQDYSANEIEMIDLDLKVLPIREQSGIFTAKRFVKDPQFKLLLYSGPQTADNLPVAVEKVFGRTFKLSEVYNLRYRKYLSFLLNSITYAETFDAPASEKFDINQGQYKYNQNHILKVIKRKRKSETTWEYTIESLTLN